MKFTIFVLLALALAMAETGPINIDIPGLDLPGSEGGEVHTSTDTAGNGRRNLMAVEEKANEDCLGLLISTAQEVASDVTKFLHGENFDLITFLVTRIPFYQEKIFSIKEICFTAKH